MKSIKKVKNYLIALSLASGLCFTIITDASEQLQKAVTISESTHFRAYYKSMVEPLPLNLIHSWILHVDTLDGNPLEKASISVRGGMPAHKHGLPTQPKITEIGDGDYLVEGLKFSMSGVWQIRFDVNDGNIADKIKFDIEF